MQDLKDLSDEELMTLYQTGQFEAFEVLYTRHSGRVFEYLKKKTSIEVARELMQEVFEKIHKSRGKYISQYPFLPWAFTIARNSLFDFFKQAESKLANSSSGVAIENLAIADSPPGNDFDLSQVLSSLPSNQRRAIELRYQQEWSFEKIARDMKTSEDNVRQIISRGIKKVRLMLGQAGGSDES